MLQPLAPKPRLGHPEPMPDPEGPERPVRRRFTAEYKLRIVEEANAASESGAVGALLRREGLYSSHLVDWRRPYRLGALSSLARPRGGPRPPPRRAGEPRRTGGATQAPPAGGRERAPQPPGEPARAPPGDRRTDHRDPGKSLSSVGTGPAVPGEGEP